jgi:predicted ATPase
MNEFKKRYILTGTPGSGKTSLIRLLEITGNTVIEEAVTDIIILEQAQGVDEPWKNTSFVDQVITLQRQRQDNANSLISKVQFFDRSPYCCMALSHYLGIEPPDNLLKEIKRTEKEKIYQKQVFFIENLGVCQSSEARKISFEEALYFEKIHEDVYLSFGFTLIKIAPQTIAERVNKIISHIKIYDDRQKSSKLKKLDCGQN